MSANKVVREDESLHDLIERFAALSSEMRNRSIAQANDYLQSAEGRWDYRSLLRQPVIDLVKAANNG